MKELQHIPVLSSLTVGLLVGMTLACLIWYLYEIGKQNAEKARKEEQQFGNLYFYIQMIINDWEVNEKTYYYILKLFVRLRNESYKNPEMMDVLERQFLSKYKVISNQILSEDEFSVEQVLRK